MEPKTRKRANAPLDILDAITKRVLKSWKQAEPFIAKTAARSIDKFRAEWESHEHKFDAMAKRVAGSLKIRRSLRKTNEDAL